MNSDITDRESVRALHHKITTTMPPIAGVAQGVMVLHDGPFSELDFEHFNETLKPKVEGSMFLHELFSGRGGDNDLDFFIFFSSVAYVVGNRGQSAYTAANAFMAGLAAHRRRRGLAASVINIGGILGLGFVSRQLTPEKRAALHRAGFAFVSERDFHEAVAEGILASRVSSDPEEGASQETDDFEITMGIRVEGTSEGKTWTSNPIFQCLASRETGSADAIGAESRSTDAVSTQLQQVSSLDEAYQIIRGKSTSVLQICCAGPLL